MFTCSIYKLPIKTQVSFVLPLVREQVQQEPTPPQLLCQMYGKVVLWHPSDLSIRCLKGIEVRDDARQQVIGIGEPVLDVGKDVEHRGEGQEAGDLRGAATCGETSQEEDANQAIYMQGLVRLALKVVAVPVDPLEEVLRLVRTPGPSPALEEGV